MIVDLAVFVYFASTLCFLPIYFIVPLFFRKFEVEIKEIDRDIPSVFFDYNS